MHSQRFVHLWFSKIAQGTVYLGDDRDAVSKTGSLGVAWPLSWLWIMALRKSGVQLGLCFLSHIVIHFWYPCNAELVFRGSSSMFEQNLEIDIIYFECDKKYLLSFIRARQKRSDISCRKCSTWLKNTWSNLSSLFYCRIGVYSEKIWPSIICPLQDRWQQM